MDVFFHQYFDIDIIRDDFSFVLEGFGQTVLLSVVSAALAMSLGLLLALLRQSPGRPMMPVRALAIAYIDVMRGIPLLLVILLMSGSIPFLTFLPMRSVSRLLRQARHLLVRRRLDRAHLQRLLRRGLPGRGWRAFPTARPRRRARSA